MKAHERYLALGALASGIFVFCVFLGFGYLSGVFVSLRGASDIEYVSPLLPSGWKTYRGEGFSVGYPAEYLPQERLAIGTVYFIPEDYEEEKMYFLVQRTDTAFETERRIREVAGDIASDAITFANYPAVKYSLPNDRVEIVIDHGEDVFLLISDDPEDPIIAPMFATFTFTE